MNAEVATQDNRDGQRAERNRNIRHALLTSVPARLSGILLQVVSLPVAAFHLGPAGFSIYAMLSASLAALTLSNLGLGQSTTLHMSRVFAAGDCLQARQILAVSVAMVSLIAVAVSLLAVSLTLWSALLSVLFSQHLGDAAEPVGAVLFLCGVFLVTQVLSVFEATQLAQQKQHRLNITISLGTLISAGCVWWVASTIPSVLTILIAQHLPVVLLRIGNALSVMSNMQMRFADLKQAPLHTKYLFVDGLRFVSGTSLSNFLCHALSVLTVGFFAAPLATASFAALMNAVLLFCSALSLVAIPFRGAMPEAYRRDDYEWLRSAMHRALAFNLAIATVACIVIAFFGQLLFSVWYRGSVEPSQLSLIGAGVYCVVIAIEVANFTFLSSIGRLKECSRWLLLRSFCAAVAVFVIARLGHVDLVFWVLTLTSFTFSLIPLTMIVLKFRPN